MGSDYYETPNLDALASKSMVFTNAYSAAANRAPAQACLLSGQYTPRHKIYNVGTRPRGKSEYRRLKDIPGTDTLDTSIKTWAQCAQERGYVTATMGKWHLSEDPLPYGFDINIGGTHSGGPPKGYYPPHPNAPGLVEAPEDEYLTDRLSSEAVRFIENNRESPWLLYLTHFAVHTPIHAKKELVQKYRAKKQGKLHTNYEMATMIEAVDEGIGRIVETLKKHRLLERTIIIFYSDNGGYGEATDMDPLKGYKGSYYEGGIRVPLFIRWPGVVGQVWNTEAIVTGVDLYPTLCDMLSLEKPKGQVMDGMSLLPVLTGKESYEDRAIYWHFPAYLQSYRQTKDEQRDPLFRSRPCSVIRKGDWKLHYYYENDGVELYNLRTDISESTNLAKAEIDKREELLGLLKEWLTETEADIPKRLNPDFDPTRNREAILELLAGK